MRFVIAVLLVLAAMPWSALTASAQIPAVWLRTYPEQTQPACTWAIAAWSDGTFSASPNECDPGQAPLRADGARGVQGFSQVADNGCTETVTLWSDNSYSWVPFTCPSGAVYLKAQSRGVQPLTAGGPVQIQPIGPPAGPPLPVAPPVILPPPPPPGPPFHAVGVGYGRNCGLTQLKVSVRDGVGNPLNGIRARVEWDGIVDPPITTNPTGYTGYPAGWTDAILNGSGMTANTWRTWLVDDAGNRISDVATFQTNTDCAGPDARQITEVTFQAGPGPEIIPPPAPVPPPPFFPFFQGFPRAG